MNHACVYVIARRGGVCELVDKGKRSLMYQSGACCVLLVFFVCVSLWLWVWEWCRVRRCGGSRVVMMGCLLFLVVVDGYWLSIYSTLALVPYDMATLHQLT